MKKQEIKAKFLEFYPKFKETVAYTKLANWLAEQDSELFDKACDLAETANYSTIKRGKSFLTTCSKDGITLVTWEASRYPRSAAVVGFALALSE